MTLFKCSFAAEIVNEVELSSNWQHSELTIVLRGLGEMETGPHGSAIMDTCSVRWKTLVECEREVLSLGCSSLEVMSDENGDEMMK